MKTTPSRARYVQEEEKIASTVTSLHPLLVRASLLLRPGRNERVTFRESLRRHRSPSRRLRRRFPSRRFPNERKQDEAQQRRDARARRRCLRFRRRRSSLSRAFPARIRPPSRDGDASTRRTAHETRAMESEPSLATAARRVDADLDHPSDMASRARSLAHPRRASSRAAIDVTRAASCGRANARGVVGVDAPRCVTHPRGAKSSIRAVAEPRALVAVFKFVR